jgi:hypothetical protein
MHYSSLGLFTDLPPSQADKHEYYYVQMADQKNDYSKFLVNLTAKNIYFFSFVF